jgi:hypothetical protein
MADDVNHEAALNGDAAILLLMFFVHDALNAHREDAFTFLQLDGTVHRYMRDSLEAALEALWPDEEEAGNG